jgi:hypothetical protein
MPTDSAKQSRAWDSSKTIEDCRIDNRNDPKGVAGFEAPMSGWF